MTSMKTYLIFVATFISNIYGEDDIIKSSLTFVIDDTYSMAEEISQVKDSVHSIFNTVVSNKNSQIGNFTLVTFNDYDCDTDYCVYKHKQPDATLLTTTQNEVEFKNALDSIEVHGGGLCPEYAMKGIKLALENSLPRSLLYVFTDASAKDHEMYEEIRILAQKKNIQVTFLLTDTCTDRDDTAYKVYYELADATNGEVFNLMKGEIKEILKYVKENIKGSSDVLVSKKFAPGYDNKVNITVDSKTTDVVISATGLEPKIQVINPEGEEALNETIVHTKEVMVVKVMENKTGDYIVNSGSKSETTLTIKGITTVNFQHGFSSFPPTSLDGTATRPAPDGNTYLSIKLHGDGVKLEMAKILDLDRKVVKELPLRLFDEETKFYMTELFDPPTTSFYVEVHGYDEEKRSPISRTSATPIERQAHETGTNKAPIVTIDGGATIITDYNAKLMLMCKVQGYPKPVITWQEKETGVILPSTVSTIEEPYDYMSILNIEKANKNSTYECKAKNSLGVNIKQVIVGVKRYLNVVESPKEIIKVKYDEEGTIVCKIDAEPPATITWYKDGRILADDDDIQISDDMATVTIKHVNLETQGQFICEARNDFYRKHFRSNVLVYGLEEPKINKTIEEIRVFKGKDTQITCQIIQGAPKPEIIQWYFRRLDGLKYKEMSETGEVVNLKNVSDNDVGTYKCSATNLMGNDLHAVDLIMEYPPIIKDDKVKVMLVKEGDIVTLPCDVDAVPKATVKWLKDESRFENKNIRMTTNHNLKFRQTMVSDTGNYTCVANNKFGSRKKTVYLDVVVPVHIEIPKVTNIETMVGQNLALKCIVDGFPKPEVKWIYNAFKGKRSPKKLRANIRPTSLGLRKIQVKDQGFYTCQASNRGGSSNITYTVIVNAPPVIENIYPHKKFTSVIGDVALRIRCKATGSPTPTIIWKKDDLNIALGSEWYDTENDTLIIKNLDEKSQGLYLCTAKNKVGKDTIVYDVVVNDFPQMTYSASVPTMYVKDGKTAHIKCDIPHQKIDSLRWYKNNRLLAHGELHLYIVRYRDEGTYSCRVSNSTKSLSAHVNVKVGIEPYFLTEEVEVIDFVPEDYISLICYAKGEPEVKVSWKHNGKEIDETEMEYNFKMSYNKRGTYTCTVSNPVGSIERNFQVVSQDCILDISKDFLKEKQPLMLSSSMNWPIFEIQDGHMTIKNTELFYLHCPKGFAKFPTKYITAFCISETKVKIDGNIYEYAEIECKEESALTVRINDKHCLPGNTEYIQVGYKVLDKFLNVYEVCLDRDNNMPLFTKHELSMDQYGVTNKITKWSETGIHATEFNSVYNCKNQVNDIESVLGTVLPNNSCCFDRRQLINPKDLRPGVPVAVANTYLNVVPHWSTCNSKNWADMEERVRNLAKLLKHDLTVTTGTAKRGRKLTHSKDIVLHDDRGREQAVAQYLWKVIQDPLSSQSLAIIQVNVPNLTPEDVASYVQCEDICDKIEWMKGTNWRNVDNGYTYCCSIFSFEVAFNYYKQFSIGKTAILNYIATPEYSYSI